jgi:hypothetical protein
MPRRDVASGAVLAASVALAVALWRTRVHAVPTASGVWRGVADLPSPVALAAAAFAGVLAAALLARSPRAVRFPLLALALAAAPLVPLFTGHLVLLLALQGPGLFLVACAALIVAAARARGEVPRPPPALLFAAAFVFYALLGTRLPGPAGPQGDEPHYLLMCQSLLSDGDLDLADDYANAEYSAFYAGPLPQPHLSPSNRAGRSYSFHSPGLPLLLLPGYALGGYAGTRVILGALAALTGILVHRLVREALGDEGRAVAAWACVTFVPPLSLFALRIYPETVAALATVVFLLTARRELDARGAAAAAACAALLPWLHSKFVVLACVGLLLTLVRPGRWAWRAAALVAFAASLALLLLVFHDWYGHASLAAAYGAPDLSLARIPRGLGALFFDRQFGLFPSAPLWLLGVPGLAVLWRRRPGDVLRVVLLAAPVAGIAATFPDWTGGMCPPARYLLPLVPGLALGLSAAMPLRPTSAAALAGLGVGVVALAAEAPRVFHNWADGESHLLRFLSPAVDLNALLPSFFEAGWGPPLLALSLGAAAALAWRFGVRGLLASALGYGLVLGALRGRALLPQRVATAYLLAEWDGDNWNGPLGPPVLASLRLPFDFAPFQPALVPGETQLSPFLFNLPPGRYRLEARVRRGGEGKMRVRLAPVAGGLSLGKLDLDEARPGGEVTLTLPVGAFQLRLDATGLEGHVERVEAWIVPEAVVRLRSRRGLFWPRRPSAAAYRVEAGDLRVTVLDGSVPDGRGFRIEGDARFAVEGPIGTTVEVWIERQPPEEGQVLTWGERSVPLGRLPGVRVWLPLSEGASLGSTAVVAVHLRAPGVWVRFASAERHGVP